MGIKPNLVECALNNKLLDNNNNDNNNLTIIEQFEFVCVFVLIFLRNGWSDRAEIFFGRSWQPGPGFKYRPKPEPEPEPEPRNRIFQTVPDGDLLMKSKSLQDEILGRINNFQKNPATGTGTVVEKPGFPSDFFWKFARRATLLGRRPKPSAGTS